MSNLIIPPTGQVKTRTMKPKGPPPPLQAGDHLTRAEFERRYLNHPEIKKAELLEGVVFMPSPVHLTQHAEPHLFITTWIGVYKAATPGVRAGDNATVRLDRRNEVQPDVILFLAPRDSSETYVSQDDYLEGVPDLVVEIAASSAAYDLHTKKRVYERNGVKEYLVVQMYERKLDWFVWRDGTYEGLRPGADGVWRSELFPGLWLDAAAFWNHDLAAMLQTLHLGLATPEYAAWVAGLGE